MLEKGIVYGTRVSIPFGNWWDSFTSSSVQLFFSSMHASMPPCCRRDVVAVVVFSFVI